MSMTLLGRRRRVRHRLARRRRRRFTRASRLASRRVCRGSSPLGVGVSHERTRVAEERRRRLEALPGRDRGDGDGARLGRQTYRVALVGRRQIVGDLHGRRGSRRRVARVGLARCCLLARAACDRHKPDDRAPSAAEMHATQPRLERLRPSSLRARRRDIAAPAESAATECRDRSGPCAARPT